MEFENTTDTLDWVSRLAGALDDLSRAVMAVRINLPTLTNSQYRDLAENANRSHDAHLLFEAYRPQLDSYPSTAVGILQEHPVVRRNSADSGDEPAIMAVIPPGSATRVELDWLATWLTKTAVRKGGRYAAGILDRLLNLSEAKALPGHEIALFRGPRVDRCFEIAQGAFIAPYAEMVGRGLLREPEKVPWEKPPDYRQMGAAAIVRTLTWGPCIKPPMTSRTAGEEMVPYMSFPCLGNREGLGVLLDLLSIQTRCGVEVLSVQYREADFMAEIAPRFRATSKLGLFEASMIGPRRAPRNSFEPAHADALREAIRDWTEGHNVHSYALRRLASSVDRSGRFHLEDSILDLSIALETMYKVDRELRYKLRTRAGYFLGSNANERNIIFARVGRFYDARSAIVHGSTCSRQRLEQASSEGFEVAKDTLFKLLRTRNAPSSDTFWNDLVMTGAMPSAPTATAESGSP